MKDKYKIILVSDNIRLLDLLDKELKDLSIKKIKPLLKYKMIEVNGKIITNANYNLKPKDKVKVYFSRKPTISSGLKIIYEDEDIIVINKPAGLLSISNSKEKEITAFRLVSDYIKANDKNAKLFVVHRLDQGTSGVLMFAKNQTIKEKLQRDWNSLVKLREYVAVVEGVLSGGGTIKSYLTMNHFQIVYSTKNAEIGNLAITHYRSIKSNNGLTLLEVDIDTGRRNQIRVHMSEKGYPIVGDKKYGSKSNPINRLALHASKLHLIDPRTGQLLKFEAPAPKDILNLVE